MSAKYTFNLRSEDRRRDLPRKLILGQGETETIPHVILKLLGYVLFYRERLQIETALHDDNIPFTPDLVQLDFELRPVLWVECGECGVNKLHKLAVKVPEAEIWVMKRSLPEAEHLLAAMARDELRRDRYQILALDAEMFEEMCGHLQPRNELLWVKADFEEQTMQFDFNSLWFDAPFRVLKF